MAGEDDSMSTDHLGDHDDFGGLHRDLAATRQAVRFSRRQMVRALGVVVPAAIAVRCGDDGSPTSPTSSTSTSVASSCTGQQRIPNETAGPYPGDGTNGPNVLVMSGVVRSDITSSFGGMSGVAPGVMLTVAI
jgi:hypothetical protein